MIWYGSPHEPYSGLPKDLALYNDLPNSFGNKMVSLTSNETGLQIQRLQREVLRERFAEISAMDRSIGQVRDYLQHLKLRDNTLLWYFGDNGTPMEANATVPFRGEKSSIYEGGIRVPSVLEWPSRLTRSTKSDVNMVSSDVFPTLAAIIGQQLPNRPLDGTDILPIIEGNKASRLEPIKFWNGKPRDQKGSKPIPYIDPKLQMGTTPLAKIQDGVATRNFKNFQHQGIQEQDFMGPRAILDNNYKLVIHDLANGKPSIELFDVQLDPTEKNNLISRHTEIAKALAKKLRQWQESVLKSLTGEDYN